MSGGAFSVGSNVSLPSPEVIISEDAGQNNTLSPSTCTADEELDPVHPNSFIHQLGTPILTTCPTGHRRRRRGQLALRLRQANCRSPQRSPSRRQAGGVGHPQVRGLRSIQWPNTRVEHQSSDKLPSPAQHHVALRLRVASCPHLQRKPLVLCLFD